jgi:hypothetical protein
MLDAEALEGYMCLPLPVGLQHAGPPSHFFGRHWRVIQLTQMVLILEYHSAF